MVIIAIVVFAGFSCKSKPTVKHDNLSLEPCTLTTKTYLNDDTTGLSLDISLSISLPSAYPDETILNKVRQTVLLDFFPEADSVYANPSDALNAYVKDYKKFFLESESGYADPDEEAVFESSPWYNYEKMLIRYNDNYIFSYTIFSDRYTGGAHGGKNYLNTIIDLNTGEKITEDDLFSEEAKPLIIKMIIRKILDKHQLKTVEELEEIGFFDISEIAIDKNFYLTDDGLTFTYNEYEIAGYAVGTTEVTLDFTSLSGFMKSGNPLEAFMP